MYDWQLPSYKPMNVNVNTAYQCQLCITPRQFQPTDNKITQSNTAVKLDKTNLHVKTINKHLQHMTLVYKKFEQMSLLGYRELNFNFTKIGNNKHKQKVLLNQKIANPEKCQVKGNIRFESAYESGNLQEAYKYSEGVYHLVVQNDSSTFGFTSWFNFKVQNCLQVPQRITLCIINMRRYASLYQHGMQPMVYTKDRGWHRGGRMVQYYKNGLTRQTIFRQYFTLSWQYDLSPLEEITFANSLPYTYCDLFAFLYSQRVFAKNINFTRTTLCTSYLNNKVEMLTIAEKNDIINKSQILLIGRVHPQETNSSYIIQAVIKYLLSDGYIPAMLRKSHCFYIVPMLNPDGVILGNSRCSAFGRDMNRQWNNAQVQTAPQVYYLKRFISQHRNIQLVLDFHGHSQKRDCFVYGTHSFKEPYLTRELPFFLNSINPSMFSFRSSNFCCGKDKAGTARKVIWEEFGIRAYSYQCSMYGNKDYYFGADDYWRMAVDLMSTLLLMKRSLPQQTLFEKNKSKKIYEQRDKFIAKLYSKTDNYEIGLRNEYQDSDSEPEQDCAKEAIGKRKPPILNPLQELSNKCRSENSLEQLVQQKCSENLNNLPDKYYRPKPYVSIKQKCKDKKSRRQTDTSANKQGGDTSPLTKKILTTIQEKNDLRFKEYKLGALNRQYILYTEIDSERDRIDSIVHRSRSDRKRIEAFQFMKGKQQSKRYSSVKKRRLQQNMTLPDELQPSKLQQKRKSNLMQFNEFRLNSKSKKSVVLSEFLDRPWLV